MLSVIVIGHLTPLDPLVQCVHHRHLTLDVMVFITCNQRMGLILLTKQATFTTFAMYGIVGEVNNNALLVQTMLY